MRVELAPNCKVGNFWLRLEGRTITWWRASIFCLSFIGILKLMLVLCGCPCIWLCEDAGSRSIVNRCPYYSIANCRPFFCCNLKCCCGSDIRGKTGLVITSLISLHRYEEASVFDVSEAMCEASWSWR